MKLLKNINCPNDLRKLNVQQLPELAQEVREFIIDKVSKTGGHLAPSLGAVDFTVALYYCLNMPKDSVVWDVGHQAYSHKILTGRKDNFHTLRQKDGISGFPHINESEYDAFTVGHGSTSISTALGLCGGRDINGTDEKVVAVIGDGSLGGGMAFEGLNHAGQTHKDLLIILNDNEFSISPSVGAFSKYLNRMISNPIYNRIRDDVERLVRRVPKLGFRMVNATKRLEDSLKNLLVPGILFDEMGIRYFGPVDGHDVPAMVAMMKNVLPLKEPRMIHVITKKGKGYKPAEQNPSKFHGTAPFDASTGEVELSGTRTFTQAFSDKMLELASKNKNVVAITAAMPDGTGLDKFEKNFPTRFFNVGMAEGHAVGFAAGLAKKGLVPVVAIYSTFLQRSYDQVIHDVCLQNLHVVMCLDRAGIVGPDGPTHQGAFDVSYLRHIPNIVCMAPKDLLELGAMLDFAVNYKGPISIRYPRGGVLGTIKELQGESIKFGKSEVLRVGKDAAIFALGDMVMPSLDAAAILAKENIHVEVVNARFIKPIDKDKILDVADKIGKIIVVEDNALQGGFGSYVLEVLSEADKECQVKRLGLPDKFIECAKRDELLKDLGLTPEQIAKSTRDLIQPSVQARTSVLKPRVQENTNGES